MKEDEALIERPVEHSSDRLGEGLEAAQFGLSGPQIEPFARRETELFVDRVVGGPCTAETFKALSELSLALSNHKGVTRCDYPGAVLRKQLGEPYVLLPHLRKIGVVGDEQVERRRWLNCRKRRRRQAARLEKAVLCRTGSIPLGVEYRAIVILWTYAFTQEQSDALNDVKDVLLRRAIRPKLTLCHVPVEVKNRDPAERFQ